MNELDELAREIYIRRVVQDELTYEFQGTQEAARVRAQEAYKLAEAFFAVREQRDGVDSDGYITIPAMARPGT